MSSSEVFQTAVDLMQPIYTTAVIHIVAELRDSQWFNLYTSVIYGREIDLLSVPDYVDHALYDPSLLCMRRRLSRSSAEAFTVAALTGTATCGSWTITYVTEGEVVGFRPATAASDLNESSFWETSLWSRERIGRAKIFDGKPLRNSNAWEVAEYLKPLCEARWLPVPLRRHPEKLGDLDEIWPSPISLESRSRDGAWALEVASIDISLLARDVAITGSLLKNDLIVRALHYHGQGPHTIKEDVDAIAVMVTVDGIPMDAHAHRYLRSISMRGTLYSGKSYTVSSSGSRPGMQLAIGDPISDFATLGKPRTDAVRHGAWVAGRLFRLYDQPDDSERVYDPRSTSAAVEQAFRDLQSYGRSEKASEILVADPYALDERALDAIAVAVARGGQVRSVRVLSAFSSIPKDMSLVASFLAWLQMIFDRKSREKQTAREKTEADAKLTAQKIATKLNVVISFYKIESLHDRFRLVGERLWHVGCSFNTIGQQISAVIEMRDERAKAKVVDVLERTIAKGPVFEVRP